MRETVLSVPAQAGVGLAEKAVESVCASAGLALTVKGTLKKYPGSLHWHYKRGREAGTLEITLRPEAHEIRFKIQEGRRAAWIDAMLAGLRNGIARELGREISG